ncbi:MAG: YHS domain-containing (seleno)protein [Thermoanaerobaculia bacterium]|nr:YHS domain-containing (seleno)protein [Thermoanaerobaculia bacterium]
MKHHRHLTRTLVATFTLLLPVALFAADVNVSSGLTGAGGPLAMHGYDPVAYFVDGAPRRGSAEHSLLWNGAVYRFVTRQNLDRFAVEPERYAPQYGGFCAYGVSVGKKFDGDPHVFAIVDGKLYLNLNPSIQTIWEEDVAGNIAKAEHQWPAIHSTPADEL